MCVLRRCCCRGLPSLVVTHGPRVLPVASASGLLTRSASRSAKRAKQLSSGADEGILPAKLDVRQLQDLLRYLHRDERSVKYRQHGRAVAAMARELAEPDDSAALATILGSRWYHWWQRAQRPSRKAARKAARRTGAAEAGPADRLETNQPASPASAIWAQLELLLHGRRRRGTNQGARALLAAYQERALATDVPQFPQVTQVQKIIERCDRSRAGLVGAARLLQALPTLTGTAPSVGCLAEFIRLCVERHAPLYLRFSDAIVRMMTTALEQAARNNVASELEQVTREARYLAFRYIAELGVALFPDHMRPIADERIMHWFRWTIAKVLKRYARVMQRLRVAETSRAPPATTATDQFASSKEALDRGQVVPPARQLPESVDTKTAAVSVPAPARSGDAAPVAATSSTAVVDPLLQLPVLVLESAMSAAIRLGQIVEATDLLVEYRPGERPAPFKGIHPPSRVLLRTLLKRCADEGLVTESLEVMAHSRALGYRIRPSDVAHIFNAAAEAARRQEAQLVGGAGATRKPALRSTARAGHTFERITLPALNLDIIFHLYQHLLHATACRFDLEVFTAIARAVSTAPPAEQRAERAMSVLKEVRRRRIRPSSALLQQLMLACISGGDIRRALSIHIHMAERNMPLSVPVANALIKLCLDRGHAATARAVLEDLAQRQESTSLNAETLSLLVRYWAQVGNEEQAVKTIERIRSMGSGLKPTETAYVAMLELAASRGDVQAALYWMRALERELGCESPERVSSDGVPFKASMPSEQAFFALFQCLRKAAAAETAMNLLHEYGVRYGYQPSPLVYEIVYETCLRGSRIDYMRQLRQEIQQRGVTLPPLDSLNV